MFRKTAISLAVTCCFAMPTAAQETQRVEVTGSSIKRINAEGALPVQIIRREEIQRSGATSAADLLQLLPATQGSMVQTASVGGETGGFVGVSLRGLNEQRTLVLLNGKRITQFGGQTVTGSGAAVDLNTIPLSAVERVEVLTDGASALYGTDAIAGVVNFITRKDMSGGEATVGLSYPQGGAREVRTSLTKGFGKLEEDGFNVLIAGSADRRTKLSSSERDYTSTALQVFTDKGKRYQINSGSPSPIPANVVIPAKIGADGTVLRTSELVSPYFVQNGVCPEKSYKFGARGCYYDYLQDVEIYPEQNRKNLLLQGRLKVNQETTLTGEFLYANSLQTTRIAPVPGPVPTNASQLPITLLAKDGSVVTGPLTARYRVADLGPRTSINDSDLYHAALTLDGELVGWDYSTTYVHSVSKSKITSKGYPEQGELFSVLRSGLIDPFVGPGQQSEAGLAALRATLRDGYYKGGETSTDWLGFRASKGLVPLPGGPLTLGAGANYQIERSVSSPSELAQGVSGVRFGDEGAVVPYSLIRKSAGGFLELVAPVTPSLELSSALRYDKYEGVGSTTNAKVAARWTVSSSLLLRSSFGTGFRAPTLAQAKSPEQVYGSSQNQYDCSASLAAVAASIGAVCRPDGDQYDVYAGGTPSLKPEKSKQFSAGFRLEPSKDFSFGADYWFIAIRDAFGQLPEAEYFLHPEQYASLFRIKQAGTGENYLAIFQGNQNLGKAYVSGIDFDATGRVPTPAGQLTLQANATYILRDDYQLLKGGEYYSSLAKYGADTQVMFRWQGRIAASLAVSDAWSHSLTMNFKSGYRDGEVEAEEVDSTGVPTGETATIKRKVRSHYTFDWQSNWRINRAFSAQVGVLNLFDRNPPFSIVTGGLNKGFMRGYDDRYYDPRGRTLYVNASYKF